MAGDRWGASAGERLRQVMQFQETGTSASPAHSPLSWDRISAKETTFQKLLRLRTKPRVGTLVQSLEKDGRPPPYPEVWHGPCSLLLRRTLQGGVHGERKEEGPHSAKVLLGGWTDFVTKFHY